MLGQAGPAAQSVGYPGPTNTPAPPTPTPEPDAEGLYPPPIGQPYQVIAAHESPYSATLADLRHALTQGDAEAVAAWIGGPQDVLTLDYYTESEGIGARPDAAEIADFLGALFGSGSSPVVQGYFDAGGSYVSPGGDVFVVLTGLEGQLAMPTKDPHEILGPPAPDELPIGAAAWELLIAQDGNVVWRAWWLADEYYALVADLAERDLGTYYVLR
jgi:hypothetical protein